MEDLPTPPFDRSADAYALTRCSLWWRVALIFKSTAQSIQAY